LKHVAFAQRFQSLFVGGRIFAILVSEFLK